MKTTINKSFILYGSIFIFLFLLFFFFFTQPMYRDVEQLSDLRGSGVYVSGYSLLLSGDGTTLSGSKVFSAYEDHPLWQSSLLINEAYNELLVASRNSHTKALSILSDTVDLLSGSLASTDYSFYEKKLFSDQLHTVKKLQVLGGITSCLLSPIDVRDSLESLLYRIQGLLLSLQQLESKLYAVLQKLDTKEYITKDCIQRLMAKNRGVQQQLLQLYDVLTALYDEYDQRVTLVRNDINVCKFSENMNIFDTKESEAFINQLESDYSFSLLSLQNNSFENLCQNDDGSFDNTENELNDLLEKIGEQSDSQDSGGSTIDVSNLQDQENEIGGSEIQNNPDYKDIVSPDTKSYIDQLQRRSEEYQKELEEFLQGSSSSPDIFLKNLYKEFYGEDKDFQERSEQSNSIKKGEW